MSTLQNQIAAQERDDVGRAVRGMLRHPWITAGGQPELFDLVRRRSAPVGRWFEHYLGWELVLQADLGYARLSKRGAGQPAVGDVRPLRRRRSSAAPFDRLRYVLLCVVAAEALDARMVTLGELADRTARACTADMALPAFRTDRQEHRRAFVDAVVVLEDFGALTAVDGQTLGFADDASAAVLYRVAAQALHHLLSAAQGPSLALGGRETEPDDLDGTLALLAEEPGYGIGYRGAMERPEDDAPDRATATRRLLWARHSFLRRLFDDAVVHREELTAPQLAYLASISGMRVVREAADSAGFALEERAEGYLLVDPDRASGPDVFPGDGAASAVGLHVLTHLLGRGDDGAAQHDVVTHVEQLLAEHPTWARTYRDENGAQRLVDEALSLLHGHQLVGLDDGVLRSRPAAARYRDARLSSTRARPRSRPEQTPEGPPQDQFQLDDEEEGTT